MIGPSRRWYLIALAIGLVAPLAVVLPAAWVWWVGGCLLWVAVGGIEAVRVGSLDLDRLTLACDGTLALSVGRPLAVRYRWAFPDRDLTIRIVETPPPQITSPEPLDRMIRLRTDREVTEERLLVPVARGVADRWRFDLRVFSPRGLVWRQRSLSMAWPLTVYPRLRDAALQQLPSQSRIRREAGQRQVRRLGEGRLFESLREWVPGDEIRTIDWKASGRRGKLIARQYEDERRQRVMLVLDAGRLLAAETAGRARLEDAIEAIGQLAYRAIGGDDDVGLLVFTDQVDHYVAPRRGRRALRAILETLATVEGRLVESNYPLAFAFLAGQTKRRALTVVFTDVIDRFASDALVAQVGALRPRHLPVAVALRDVGLEVVASRRPVDGAAAFDRAAAEQLLAVRAEALGQMRSRGVVVVDAHPDSAAKSVVECYLQLKRRAMI